MFLQEGVCHIDLRSSAVTCAVENPVNSFDIDAHELITLTNNSISYNDIRNIDTEMNINGDTFLNFKNRLPYTYIKADRNRIGLMSSSSLMFKNHGEINSTGKHISEF
jgi:hypothetical protein